MRKTYAEIERLKKAMEEENINSVHVNRIDRFDKDGNREPSGFSVSVNIYDMVNRPKYLHRPDDEM